MKDPKVGEVKPKKDKSLCNGCYNQDYWYGLGGAKECWSFKSGKVIKRLAIPNYQAPPYDKDHSRYMLSCYNKKGMCYASPDRITSEGYWK